MSGWRSGGSESIRKGGSSHLKFIAKCFDVKQGLQGPQKPSQKMASNSNGKTVKRPNRYINNGDMVDKGKCGAVSD